MATVRLSYDEQGRLAGIDAHVQGADAISARLLGGSPACRPFVAIDMAPVTVYLSPAQALRLAEQLIAELAPLAQALEAEQNPVREEVPA